MVLPRSKDPRQNAKIRHKGCQLQRTLIRMLPIFKIMLILADLLKKTAISITGVSLIVLEAVGVGVGEEAVPQIVSERGLQTQSHYPLEKVLNVNLRGMRQS
jgi:hypothetical protein